MVPWVKRRLKLLEDEGIRSEKVNAGANMLLVDTNMKESNVPPVTKSGMRKKGTRETGHTTAS